MQILPTAGPGLALARRPHPASEDSPFETLLRALLDRIQPPTAQAADQRFRTEVQALFIHWVQIRFSGGTPNDRPTFQVQVLDVRVQTQAAGQNQSTLATVPRDPLAVDFSGCGPETTGADGARTFDLGGTGEARPTSWAKGDTAFLALDRNGNGAIDSGAELFGDQHGAPDGYAELAKFDANRDQVIDAQDPVFDRLRLLFGDGHLASLSEARLQSLSLAAVASGAHTRSGDAIFSQASARTFDGRSLQTYALGLHQFPPQPC